MGLTFNNSVEQVIIPDFIPQPASFVQEQPQFGDISPVRVIPGPAPGLFRPIRKTKEQIEQSIERANANAARERGRSAGPAARRATAIRGANKESIRDRMRDKKSTRAGNGGSGFIA